jgi:hypothetical protein
MWGGAARAESGDARQEAEAVRGQKSEVRAEGRRSEARRKMARRIAWTRANEGDGFDEVVWWRGRYVSSNRVTSGGALRRTGVKVVPMPRLT